MSEDQEYLPTIPVEELVKIVSDSLKIEKQFKIGTTNILILKGSSYIGKRSISLRAGFEEIDYDYAMGIAYKARKIAAVMDWFELNKNFKEGGYIVPNAGAIKTSEDNQQDLNL